MVPPADAAGTRPSFQIPFRCGERWTASSRSGHPAIDWNKGTGSADLGMPVTASAAGKADAKYHGEYGYHVDIDHGGGWVTRYAHLLATGRREGNVAQGEIIGYVGSSGRSSSPHLHWEQRENDVPRSTLTADDAVVSGGREYTSRNCLRRDPFLAGDVDNDGDDDMVARFVNADGSSTVRTVAGDDVRELSARTPLSLTGAAMPATALLTLGDTNGDRHADLNGAYAYNGGVRLVSFYGRADGTFGEGRVRYFNANWQFRRLQWVRAADVDGDGIADLTARFIRPNGSSVIRTVRGSTARELSRVRSKSVEAANLPASAKVALGDTNGDRRADLNAAVPASAGTRLVSFYGQDNGSFGSRRSRTVRDGWKFRKLQVLRGGDVDGDGVDDVVARYIRKDGSSAIRSVFGRTSRSLPRTTTKTVSSTALPVRAFVAVGDTNGNGRADLNAAMGAGEDVRFATFAGSATGEFQSRTTRYFGRSWGFHRLC